jgi:hypothetical protein
MKILGTFDKIVTEVLADKVRARLTFKVNHSGSKDPIAKWALVRF